MKYYIYLLPLFLWVPPKALEACQCTIRLNFCEALDEDSKVFVGQVVKKYSGVDVKTFMDVKVVEVIKGELTDRFVTLVHHGTSCDVNLDYFGVDRTYIYQFRDLESSYELANYRTFSLDFCPFDFLVKEGNAVHGNIDSRTFTAEYDDFKNNVGQCVSTSIFDRDSDQVNDILVVSPNPTTSFLDIRPSFPENIEVSGMILNSKGQSVVLFDNAAIRERLDVSYLPVGVYFLRLNFGTYSITKRIVKF